MASTIKDISAETGLALATISKFLNGGNVKQENREKIEAAVKKLNYRPNLTARALITKKTRTIAFVVNVISSQFSGLLLKYAGELLRRQGYSMMICDSDHDPKLEAENIRFCVDKNVDGIMLMPVGMDGANLRPAEEAGIPVVLLDREMNKTDCDCVTIDNRMSAKRAVQYLISCGHTKIAVIHSMEYTGNERYLGYREAMEQAHLPVPETYVHSGEMHSTELGYETMKQLLALPDRPTAVFMTNYEVSLGVVMALNEAQLRCPDDISLVGFDELVLTLVMKPKMTVVAQPMEELCRETVRLLLERIAMEDPVSPRRVSIYADLKEGASVRRLA